MKTDYDFEPKKPYKKTNLLIYLLIALLGMVLASILTWLLLGGVFKYNTIITSNNRGDYLAIMGTHCSVVFLTTSLMAMLSERNRYIYWVEMVTKILISPRYMSFIALVTYSLSTIVGSFLGLLFRIGPVVIGSFIFGIISVTILFSRMVSIYYQNDKIKKNIEEFLFEKINSDEYEKYLIRLKEITLIKAEQRDFTDVYENLNLMESCLNQIWREKPRENQPIFQPVGFCEELYVDIMSDLSIQFPQEMQEYIENRATKNSIIKKLGCLIYPVFLNSYLGNHRTDLFDRTLCKWSKITEQRFDVIDYIIRTAKKHTETITEYYGKLYNPFNYEIKIKDDSDVYIDVLRRLYYENPDAYKNILQWNREAILLYYYDSKNVCGFPLDVLAIVAECAETETDKCVFISFVESLLNDEIYRHKNGSDSERKKIEKNPLIAKMVDEFTCKREEDFDFSIKKIMDIIQNSDSNVYLNAGDKLDYYKDFEQRALDDGMSSVKKKMEEDDRINHSSDNKNAIDILQTYLEKLNYKGRRVPENQAKNDNINIAFVKSYFENGQLAIHVYSDEGDKVATVTKEFNYHNTEELDFEKNAVLIDCYTCPENIIMFMLKQGYIRTIGRGYQVNGKGYPIALVNEDWLMSLDSKEN